MIAVQKANEARALTLINLVNEAERRVEDLHSLVTMGTNANTNISNTQQKVRTDNTILNFGWSAFHFR